MLKLLTQCNRKLLDCQGVDPNLELLQYVSITQDSVCGTVESLCMALPKKSLLKALHLKWLNV